MSIHHRPGSVVVFSMGADVESKIDTPERQPVGDT